VSHDPDVYHVVLSENDYFLILACDGMWDVISDQEAVTVAFEAQDPQTAAVRLINMARKKGSGDNISVISIFLKDRNTWCDDTLDGNTLIVKAPDDFLAYSNGTHHTDSSRSHSTDSIANSSLSSGASSESTAHTPTPTTKSSEEEPHSSVLSPKAEDRTKNTDESKGEDPQKGEELKKGEDTTPKKLIMYDFSEKLSTSDSPVSSGILRSNSTIIDLDAVVPVQEASVPAADDLNWKKTSANTKEGSTENLEKDLKKDDIPQRKRTKSRTKNISESPSAVSGANQKSSEKKKNSSTASSATKSRTNSQTSPSKTKTLVPRGTSILVTRPTEDREKSLNTSSPPKRSVSTGRVKFDQINTNKAKTLKKESNSTSKDILKVKSGDQSGEETEEGPRDVNTKTLKRAKTESHIMSADGSQDKKKVKKRKSGSKKKRND